ncbi:FtsK/SpoIIIE domain-containing protein [Streptomyces sp. NPDC047999]|uniref:FtsK/SpoIIIE domain-containing protein n=1 Tax=Streptomyces sp. NPDC047999 TaxID=3365497 RepID=UPI0037219297
MSKKRKQEAEQDLSAQLAGAIGGLVIVTGGLAAIKDKTGLSWPATVLLTAGVLVLLGYAAWKVRTAVRRLLAGNHAVTAASRQEAPAAAELAAEETAPVHTELTAALTKAGAIGRDEVIRLDEVTVNAVPGLGERYDFLVPKGRTVADVEKRLANVAGTFGVTRLHTKLERARDNERRVRLLVLDQEPFSRPFPSPTREEIRAYPGVPFGHDVTGQLTGVETFDKASLLVGGMTQMGKTTLINGIITCLLIAYGEFELYLLDGKHCGLTRFEKIAVRYEASDDPAVMEAMLDELNGRVTGRYKEMTEAIRARKPAPKFRPVFFIVDEAADFFTSDGSDEGKDQARRVADKARSLVSKSLESGISAIMLTQRPANNAIPVIVRDQFLYRMCLYVASEGTAKVALGDTYFDTIAPIGPQLLNPKVKGQAVLFAQGASTLIRGFDFSDEFVWSVVDGIANQQHAALEAVPESPLKKAIYLIQESGADFMTTAELAPALGIDEADPVERGKQLAKLLGVTAGRTAKGRGYKLADLVAALKTAD